MNLRNIIAQIILPALIGIIWSLIGILEEPNWEQFKINYGQEIFPCVNWMWDKRISCGWVISIIIFSIIVLMTLNNKPSKRWLKVYLKHLMSELFNDDYSNTRINILKKVSGIRMLLLDLKYILFICPIQHIKERTFWLHLKRIPNPFQITL